MITQTTRTTEEKLVVTIPTGFLQNKFNVTACFTLGVLLFFLPFITITCNDMRLADATGLEIATGFKIEPGKDFEKMGKGLFNKIDKESSSHDETVAEKNQNDTGQDISIGKTFNGNKKQDEEKAVGSNYFMMAALAVGALGIIFSLVPFKKRWLCCMVAGWTGVAAFIMGVLFILDRTREFRVDIGVIKLSVNFTIWFFLSFASFIAAAIFSNKHRLREWTLAKQNEIDEFIKDSAYTSQEPSIRNEVKEPNS